MTGGYPSSSYKSVEAISSYGTSLCTLPDLPDDRAYHTMDEHVLCGGELGKSSSSCYHYVAGLWTKYRRGLQNKRARHLSWMRQDGQLILIGGSDTMSKKTSEVVSSSGDQKQFALRYETK